MQEKWEPKKIILIRPAAKTMIALSESDFHPSPSHHHTHTHTLVVFFPKIDYEFSKVEFPTEKMANW